MWLTRRIFVDPVLSIAACGWRAPPTLTPTPSRACAFDIFLWVPTHPRDGHHVTNHSQRSSAMLAALGAKAAGDEAAWCGGDVGVLPGSTASDLGRCLHT